MRGEQGAILDPRVMAAVGEIDREEAIRALSAAIEEHPEDTSLLMARAQLHRLSDAWFDAIRDYQTLLSHDPEDAGALNNLAWMLLEEAPEELRNRTEAERLATRALEVSPNDPYVLGTYGTARLRAGDAAEAAIYLRRALETKRPSLDESTDYYLLAIALAVSGLDEEARQLLEHAIRTDPGNDYRSEAEGATASIHRAPSL
jgi:Flp pilus assembly protein TadD